MDHKALLLLAYKEAVRSPDPSTQNGAVLFFMDGGEPIVETLDHNRFPRDVLYYEKRWERPKKYSFIEHAERNSIYTAARQGIQTQGLAMASPWAPCSDCARAIIEAGLVQLVTHRQAHNRSPERWAESIEPALEMLREARVSVVFHDEDLKGPALLHTGQWWRP